LSRFHLSNATAILAGIVFASHLLDDLKEA
jgi:hypothetical protein